MLLVCMLFTFSSSVAAEPESVINNLYPTEVEMGIETNIELEYKKVPPEYYKWDSDLKFAEWSGIFPELKNPGDVTENTIAAAIFRSGVQLVRFGVFLLQMGFSTNILTASLDEIDGKISALSEHFFKKVFPAASTLLLIFMIIAWVRGQKGEMVSMLLVALLASTLLIGGIKYIDDLAQVGSDIIDDLSLSVLGITNLDGNENSARDGGLKRLAQTNNMIWQVTVDLPWTSGQFGSLKPPGVTGKESGMLSVKNVSVSGNWKDLFLSYAPGSIERKALVDVLADEDIDHEGEAASNMMKELGPPVRSMVGLISFVNSLAFLLLTIVVAGLMNVSGILLLAGIVAAPFMVPLPFLAHIGMGWVKKYLGLMIQFALLKISATVYISIVMLLLFLLSLLDWHFILIQGMTLLILSVAIYLSPNIWKRMSPGIAKISGIVEQRAKGTLKKVAPQENTENLFDRYAKRRKDTSSEELMEKNRMKRIRDTRNELESLTEIKRNNPAQFEASGLDERETELSTALRKEELSKMSLDELQNERFKYENKIEEGVQLSSAEQADLKLVQQQERQQVRAHVMPEQRRELDQVWSQQKQFHQQKLTLQQQKMDDPMLHVRQGGEAKMQHLNANEQLLQQKEHDILRENALKYNEKKLIDTSKPLTSEERSQRGELSDYLKKQQGESVMKNHLSNESPEIATPDRQMFIESLNRDELQKEQEAYHVRIENGEQLTEDEKNDYNYINYNDWKQAISNHSEKDKLESLHMREVSIESELSRLDKQRTSDHAQFVASGGEEKYQEVQISLYDTRQQTQEILRNSGNSDLANQHVKFAENRDMVRTNSYDQNGNKHHEQEKANKEDKVIELNDYRQKPEQTNKDPKITEEPIQPKQFQQVHLNPTRQPEQTRPNEQHQQANTETVDLSKTTFAEYTTRLREERLKNFKKPTSPQEKQ